MNSRGVTTERDVNLTDVDNIINSDSSPFTINNFHNLRRSYTPSSNQFPLLATRFRNEVTNLSTKFSDLVSNRRRNTARFVSTIQNTRDNIAGIRNSVESTRFSQRAAVDEVAPMVGEIFHLITTTIGLVGVGIIGLISLGITYIPNVRAWNFRRYILRQFLQMAAFIEALRQIQPRVSTGINPILNTNPGPTTINRNPVSNTRWFRGWGGCLPSRPSSNPSFVDQIYGNYTVPNIWVDRSVTDLLTHYQDAVIRFLFQGRV